MTKQSRKELLKRDDAFIVAAGQATTWFTHHRTLLIGGVGALLVVALGVIGFSAYGNGQSKEASRHFAEGWKLAEARTKKPTPDGQAKAKVPAKGQAAAADANAEIEGDAEADPEARAAKADEEDEEDDDRPTFATSKEKWAAARTAFEEAENTAGGRKGVGAMAALMVGNLSDKLGEHDKAEKEFAALRQALPQKDSLSFLPAERFAYAREAAGDLDGAIAALNELAGDEQRFYADYAQMHQARLHLAKGDKDKARSMLEHIVQAFPETSLEDEVKAKLAELGGGGGSEAVVPPIVHPAPAGMNSKATP